MSACPHVSISVTLVLQPSLVPPGKDRAGVKLLCLQRAQRAWTSSKCHLKSLNLPE